MGKIFCLIGKSGSGKDSLFNKLINNESLELKSIITYTTRPIRIGEVDGREYHFMDENTLDYYQSRGKIIERRTYSTVNGLWHYATVDDGQVNLLNHNYLIIATLQSYRSLSIYYGSANVEPLYIEVEDGLRLSRALNRERIQKTPNYIELCRRFIADSEDFSSDNLHSVGIVKRYINDNFDKCLSELIDTIRCN